MEQAKHDHFFPFLWVHGESEAVYRRMIQAIDEANIKQFCVESRPHDDFLQDAWWHDMDIIIDEAKKRNMQFYILDDKHFPTGYAAGALENAPVELHRQSLFYKAIPVKKGEKVDLSVVDQCVLTPTYNQLGAMMNQFMNNDVLTFDDDRLYSASFYTTGSYVDLDGQITDGRLSFTADADGDICLCFLTRNAGIHRNYINMLEADSVRLLIDEVYEKHYAHYADEFGKTILGFFSDEPELGNSTYTNTRVDMGDDPNLDFCFSGSLDQQLQDRMDADYRIQLPLLWRNDFDDKDLISRVRYQFMSTLTNQVSQTFSRQIGDWCLAHGVSYIGHVIEDNNLHAKTCSSLGHYFKGLKYQTMAGIDDIGGQVIPFHDQGIEQMDPITSRDGTFYHYCLAKLAVSLAQINPRMQKRSMCEIFGNYGWKEGVWLEKYLLDHFMVRGVNHFVPHAFTCAPYPDSDCPPHFYAQGNNPQYRHFGQLMSYGNRVCQWMEGSDLATPVAILYHAESEWCGERMLIQEPARVLYDHQIDYTFIPSEVFSDREFYHTDLSHRLCINGQQFPLFVVAECQRLPAAVADAIVTLLAHGQKVCFINRLPIATCEGTPLPVTLANANVVSLEDLASYAASYACAALQPANDRLHIAHYTGGKEFYYLFNEGEKTYQGQMILPTETEVMAYDPYADQYYALKSKKENGQTMVDLSLESVKSLFLVTKKPASLATNGYPSVTAIRDKYKNSMLLEDFTISHCRAIDYPKFTDGDVDDDFSGFLSYEKTFAFPAKDATLVIDQAYEGVEVFVNDHSLGIQIVPSFIYDLSSYIKEGQNKLRIEVASTLQRERRKDVGMEAMILGIEPTPADPDPIGISGNVTLYFD